MHWKALVNLGFFMIFLPFLLVWIGHEIAQAVEQFMEARGIVPVRADRNARRPQ